MDFEELQVVWDSQDNVNKYIINEAELHNYLKKKGKSINNSLKFFEFIITLSNLFLGIWLIVESLDNNNPSFQSILAVFYCGFAVYTLIRLLLRRRKEKPFKRTMVGELDKAIWRSDYLMAQSRNMISWYLLPLILIIGVMSIFDTRLTIAFLMLVVVSITTYFVYRWEVRKIHLPRKHSFEALREKLIKGERG